MSRHILLPPGLIDLTLLRVSVLNGVPHRPTALTDACGSHLRIRRMSQAALATRSPPLIDREAAGHSLYTHRRRRRRTDGLAVRRGENLPKPLSELDRRVEALKETAIAEVDVSQETLHDVPEYSEEQLLSIYEDLLAVPNMEQTEMPNLKLKNPLSKEEDDNFVVAALAERLDDMDADIPSSKMTVLLKAHSHPAFNPSNVEPSQAYQSVEASTESHHRVLAKLDDIMTGLDTVRNIVFESTAHNLTEHEARMAQLRVPVGLVSMKEWISLIRVCIQEQDGDAAERALDLMKRFGLSPSERVLNDVMLSYANKGDVRRIESFMSRFLKGVRTEKQRDLHIKCYLKASPPNTIPKDALSLLHSYESRSLPAPMSTYTRLITSLFTVRSTVARAQAWDLFAHMRYVAHPNPDPLLYSLMIRACASPFPSVHSGKSEPERALDLFTEMTVDRGIQPTLGAYNAVILACARSGESMYVHEAFRLAKEMLDGWRDARGNLLFYPDAKTFSALLEGAKRVGDLARVRWILAEMVNNRADEDRDVRVNDEIMMHVFHAYAAYKPPFRRSDTLVVEESRSRTESGEPSSVSDNTQHHEGEDQLVEESGSRFSHIPPQSHHEVIQESQALFDRIVEDNGLLSDISNNNPSHQSSRKGFRDVTLSPRLLNSYLSVHYAHASLDRARVQFRTLFSKFQVRKTARTYMEALEHCANVKKGSHRIAALEFAREIWSEWNVFEDQWCRQHQRSAAHEMAVNPRLAERMHVAMIRVFTLGGELDEALEHLRLFVNRYPPTALRTITPRSSMRSMRTVLEGPRPLVRLTSATDVPDDTVPPLLTFSDLEILHQRLVAADDSQGLAYIKWVSKAYEGSLRTRRDETMRAGCPSEP